MCMFCAAIPATVAIGAAAQAKQTAALREAESTPSEELASAKPVKTKPVALLTISAVTLLAAGSAAYHIGLGNPQ